MEAMGQTFVLRVAGSDEVARCEKRRPKGGAIAAATSRGLRWHSDWLAKLD
jgi:hypothetical protein